MITHRILIRALLVCNVSLFFVPNGGFCQSWELQTPPPLGPTTFRFFGVDFLDENTGWIVGYDGSGVAGYGKTTDGGANWTSPVSLTRMLNGIKFYNSQLGYAAGFGGSVFYTSDGGNIWRIGTSGASYSYMSAVDFSDSITAWAVGYSEATHLGLLYYTLNRGENWINFGLTIDCCLNDIEFLNPWQGWIVGGNSSSNNIILHTSDAGQHWTEQFPGCYSMLKGVDFVNESVGWAVGDGRIVGTTNGGATWSIRYQGNYSFEEVKFTDVNNGWVVGYNYGSSRGAILRTTNGGASWVPQDHPSNGWLYSVDFANDSVGWVVGANNVILHTTNGGGTTIDDEEHDPLPTYCTLQPAFPNPFNANTTIRYQLSHGGIIRLNVVDVLGRTVSHLYNGNQAAGTHTIEFSGEGIASGVYFVQMQIGTERLNQKIVLLR